MSVAVCIVTYRRPGSLASVLDALVPQVEAEHGDIVVIDNDPAGSAAPVVPHGVRHVVEPRPGIPAARNRALDECSDATFVAFTDDDVAPRAGWLRALLARQTETGADVVTGPVHFVFPEGAPGWAAGAHCFRDRSDAAADPSSWAATNNVLLRRALLDEQRIRFDESYGLAGGSDTQLFKRIGRAGGAFAWADGAIVDERVPSDRARVAWVLRRSYRTGNTATLVDVEVDGRRAAIAPTLHAAMRWAWWGAGALLAGLLRRDAAGAVRAGSSFARGAGLLSGLTGRRVQEYGRG